MLFYSLSRILPIVIFCTFSLAIEAEGASSQETPGQVRRRHSVRSDRSAGAPWGRNRTHCCTRIGSGAEGIFLEVGNGERIGCTRIDSGAEGIWPSTPEHRASSMTALAPAARPSPTTSSRAKQGCAGGALARSGSHSCRGEVLVRSEARARGGIRVRGRPAQQNLCPLREAHEEPGDRADEADDSHH